jgi:hypothetical protein
MGFVDGSSGGRLDEISCKPTVRKNLETLGIEGEGKLGSIWANL